MKYMAVMEQERLNGIVVDAVYRRDQIKKEINSINEMITEIKRRRSIINNLFQGNGDLEGILETKKKELELERGGGYEIRRTSTPGLYPGEINMELDLVSNPEYAGGVSGSPGGNGNGNKSGN